MLNRHENFIPVSTASTFGSGDSHDWDCPHGFFHGYDCSECEPLESLLKRFEVPVDFSITELPS